MFIIGDLVVFKTDVNKYIYKVTEINEIAEELLLVGYSYRMIKWAKYDEVEKASSEDIKKENNKNDRYYKSIVKGSKERQAKVIFGRVLHIDGDQEFLNNCLQLYEELHIPHVGLHLHEKETAKLIQDIMQHITPDIVVITGHDSYNGNGKADLENYENSQSFLAAIREIRKLYGYQEVTIIAGACESHFEALMGSGANFASSPKRINTHTYDPAVVAIKVATTSTHKVVDFNNILKYIENGRAAIGGIETLGKMRLLL